MESELFNASDNKGPSFITENKLARWLQPVSVWKEFRCQTGAVGRREEKENRGSPVTLQ